MFEFLKHSNHIKYFSFFYERLGWHIPVLLLMSVVVTVLDAVGLALFIPLFMVAESGVMEADDAGSLAFIVRFFDDIGLALSLEVVIFIMISIFVVKAIFDFLDVYYYSRLQYNFMRRLRMRLVDGLCNVSYSGFTKIDLGRIQNVITAEIGKAASAVGSYLAAMQDLMAVIGYLALAFAINFWFTLMVLLLGMVTLGLYRFFNRKIEHFAMKQVEINSQLQGKTMELVWHYKYFKATNLIQIIQKSIVAFISKAEDISIKVGILNAITGAMREPVSILLISLVIFIQVSFLDVAMYSVILSLVFFYRALSTLLSLQSTWQGFLADSGGVHVVRNLYREFEESAEIPLPEQQVEFQSQIDFRNITFSYGTNLPVVLKDVSLTIKKNTTVAFVGQSGAGKTTMVNLVSGLLFPARGAIYIDEEVLRPEIAPWYRRKIGYITQEPVVFNDTLYNNVTLNAPKTPENLARFCKIIEDAALTETVSVMPQNEDTLLGNNGIRISGGQKQRVSIARELFRNCEILIMDEATSSLDSETERVLQSNINKLKGQLTIILIAHRLSTVRGADVIYLLENGEISASGSFEDLKVSSSIFQRMAILQGL